MFGWVLAGVVFLFGSAWVVVHYSGVDLLPVVTRLRLRCWLTRIDAETVAQIVAWVRIAARTNDSRELQESLECVLVVVRAYATRVLAR